MAEYEVTGKDLIKADKETLKYLKIANPLMQQRILDARDTVLEDPQIVSTIMAQCQKASTMELVQITKDLENVQREVAQLKRVGMQSQSGDLALGPSWTNYGGHVMLWVVTCVRIFV